MPREVPSDAEAIHRSVEDPQVFVLVFERHHAPVHRFLRARLGADAGDEMTGEAFARAFAMRARYRAEHETALPWLYGISQRLVAEQRRAERRRLRALEALAATGGVTGRDRTREGEALSPDLVRALRRLPAGQRDALLLIAWGELSYEEAATALGVPVGTVRSRIARARRRLASSSCPSILAAVPGEAHA